MSDYLTHKPGSLEEVVAKATQLESGYQDKFKKELEKTGRGIGSMTPKEKSAFFNKIDKMHKAKNEEDAYDKDDEKQKPKPKKEGMETIVPPKKEDEKDLKRKTTMTGDKPTEVDTKPEIKY